MIFQELLSFIVYVELEEDWAITLFIEGVDAEKETTLSWRSVSKKTILKEVSI